MPAEFTAFSPKQRTVLTWWHDNSPLRDYNGLICDGAVRSGKTTCMSLSFIAWAFFRFDDASFALCGKTIASLRRNIVTGLLAHLRALGFDCRDVLSRNRIDISFGGRSNRFYLFGGRDASSAALIQGMTLHGVLFDEVALMPRSFVEQALARCSPEGAKFWFNCNPEHPLHWFYTEWIQKAEEKGVLHLHFQMQDNPSLSKRVIERYASMYSGAFYDRFVLGKWVAADGLVYPQAANGAYTKAVPQTKAEKSYLSCDYGTVNPTSIGLWGLHDGVWYREREFYFDARKEGRQKTDEEYYADLEALAGERRIAAVVIDPSAASFAECVRRHGRFRVVKAHNDVLDGIRKVQDALREGRIAIGPDCRDTLREFSLYRWDESAGGDRVKKEHDHAMDDLRYFVASVLSQPEDGFFAIAASRT
ncbi:MAG: PBSX family phage terminase large subunit [Clostridia bacterium]|nr:PBSX family phage terminase large subunit [Clostridia bacterium]